MKIICLNDNNKNHWIYEINKCDWKASAFLAKIIKDNSYKTLLGYDTKIYLLIDKNELISHCTLSNKDDIDSEELTPWLGFLYTKKEFRNMGCAKKLIEFVINKAKSFQNDYLYISTNHVGFYEKFGFLYYKSMLDIHGEESRIYRIKLK